MVREFSEEKRQEIFRLLDEIDIRDWKSFMEWCGSRKEEFGDWPDKLSVSAYTRYVDQYHEKVLEINEMTRQQVNTVFENVAEIDARYAARLREHREKVKEQIAIVKKMTEFMDSMSDDIPNKAHRSGGGSHGNGYESGNGDEKEEDTMPVVQWEDVFPTNNDGAEEQEKSIIDEAEAQGIIGEPEVAFMNQLMYYIRDSSTEFFGCLDGLDALYDKGLISEENYNCLMDIHEQVNGPGDYDVSVLKEQACNVYNEIERVIVERTIVQKYINEDVFRDGLSWDIEAAKANINENFIEEMRELMLEYGLTDERSIILFLVSITYECDHGKKLMEDGGMEYFAEKLLYAFNTRGGGLIHVTGKNQEIFLQYVYDHSSDNDEKEELEKYLDGFYETVKNVDGTEYTCVNNNYDDVATFIAKNYAIEASIWYWCNNRYAELDERARSINNIIDTYCESDKADLEQYLIATQLTVNGCIFIPEVLGRLYNSQNQVWIDNARRANIIYKEDEVNDRGEHHFCEEPGGWQDRLNIYNQLIVYIMQN